MKKKGFTLIELLAVIVILAVIALIATPMILGVIETARKESAESSALGYLDAVEKQIMLNQLDSSKTPITDGVYDLPMEGISVKGEVPSEGWIVIENSEITNYSMKMMDYVVTMDEESTKEGELATKPKKIVCKRATTLHTETCTRSYNGAYCYANYGTGATITYGRLGNEGVLKSGDAFDCDVDGDGDYGEYDEATGKYTERFYYVSDYYNTETDEFETDKAVLIYYSNTTLGIADYTSKSKIAYNTDSGYNIYGPETAKTNLPTKEQWKNVYLFKENRKIVNELGTTINSNLEIENPFSYEGFAARLLTVQELNKACGKTVGTMSTKNSLSNCKYLMENTNYSTNNLGTQLYWLENPQSSHINYVWSVETYNRYIGTSQVSSVNANNGARPVIEVLKENIQI